MTRWSQRSSRNGLTAGFILLGIVWGGFLGAAQIAGVDPGIDRLENLTLDWRFVLTGARPAPFGVVVAAIDDETLHAAGAYPLPRDFVARIIRGLAKNDPRAIAVDLLLLDPGGAESDLSLAEALRGSRSVLAAAGTFDDGDPATARNLVPHPDRLLMPAPVFGTAARVGLVNIVTDRSGVPRHIPMIYRTAGSFLPSFVLAAASAAENTDPVLGSDTIRISGQTLNLDLGYHLPVRFYGPRGSIPYLSASLAALGDPRAGGVRGQVVVLGVTAPGTGDSFATPYDRNVPGVEVLATAISNVLAHDGLTRTKIIRRLDAATMILLPAAIVLAIASCGPLFGFGLAALLAATWLTAVVLAFDDGYWLNVAGPLAVLVPVTIGYLAARAALDRVIARRLTRETAVLARFQAPAIVRHLASNPGFLDRPVKQDAAVVFLDLSGFTGVTELLGPELTRELLAEFHTLIERDVEAHQGFIVGFMGDGAMILFGLPVTRSDDAARALQCVAVVHRSIRRWCDGLPPVAKERLSARIGGHFGPVVASRLGPAHHQHVTATGDTVNATSRLLEAAKVLGAEVVISDDLYRSARGSEPGDDAFVEISAAREIPIRGRARPLSVRILTS